MKYCEKCQKSFPDDQAFCSECGNKLNDAPNPIPDPNPTPTPAPNNRLNNWISVFLAAAGLLIGWFLSDIFGAALCVASLFMQPDRKKGQYEQISCFLTWALVAIFAILWIIALLG